MKCPVSPLATCTTHALILEERAIGHAQTTLAVNTGSFTNSAVAAWPGRKRAAGVAAIISVLSPLTASAAQREVAVDDAL